MHYGFRNVNDGFRSLVQVFAGLTKGPGSHPHIVKKPSRCGDVLMIDEPVTITYSHPRERVLLNAARDANPFFHMYEALWMLAGRNDVAPLAYYNSKIAQFSDDDQTLNGAYGQRWRNGSNQEDAHEGQYWNLSHDQLRLIIQHLKSKPDSRRAVLQMWNVEDDLLKVNSSKDVCCNTSVMFSIRDTRPDDALEFVESPVFLDMTVTNRSNDLVLGMLGTDYVTFSMLQEYVASCLGVEVGVYNHFTNNLHVYLDNWKPDEWLADKTPGYVASMVLPPLRRPTDSRHMDPNVDGWDQEIRDFVEVNKNGKTRQILWNTFFLDRVAQPMMDAFHCHKAGDHKQATHYLGNIASNDWREACIWWITRRHKQ